MGTSRQGDVRSGRADATWLSLLAAVAAGVIFGGLLVGFSGEARSPTELDAAIAAADDTLPSNSNSTLALTHAAAESAESAAEFFELDDGTRLPIEEWPETYETLEWQPPIDPKKAKTIVEYDPLSDYHVGSVALDMSHKKVYWIGTTGAGRHGSINRANLDGSNPETLLDGWLTPDGEKELYYARGLCVVPELRKLYWTCNSPLPETPGYSIYEADLDCKRYRPIVTGLHSCCCVVVDAEDKKIYFNDDRTLQRVDLNGSALEDLGADLGLSYPFAIDPANRHVYSRIKWNNVIRQSLDGSNRATVYSRPRGDSAPNSNMEIDLTTQYLYWETRRSIVRASLEEVSEIETILASGPDTYIRFAVDNENGWLYWTSDNSTKLLAAELPAPWRRVAKPAPPLITSIHRQEIELGGKVIITGKGLETSRRVFWIGFPSAECLEGKFRTMTDGSLVTMVPTFQRKCSRAAIVVVAEGGATVTVPHETEAIEEVVIVKRRTDDSSTANVVRSDGFLDEVESRALVVEAGCTASPGLRGGNVFFVRNGGMAVVRELDSAVFHEPHANLSFVSEFAQCIAVPAIRYSFVEELFKCGSED